MKSLLDFLLKWSSYIIFFAIMVCALCWFELSFVWPMIICRKLLYNLCYTLRIGLEYKEDTVDMICVYVAPAYFSTCHHMHHTWNCIPQSVWVKTHRLLVSILQITHTKELITQNLFPNNLVTNNTFMVIQVTVINVLLILMIYHYIFIMQVLYTIDFNWPQTWTVYFLFSKFQYIKWWY